MLGPEWVIATYKHPALPSWVLEASRLLTGAVGWPAYLISQIFVATTFAFVFLLGRDLMGAERGAAGALLLAGVAYFAWPTTVFNHNVAEAPFWAAIPWALWRAVECRSIFRWVLVGLLAAVGLYAKLSIGLLLITAGGWIVFDARARASLLSAGPWIGLAVFAAIVTPLGYWLVAHDFAPLAYAARPSNLSTATVIVLTIRDMLLSLAAMFAMLAVAGLIGPTRRHQAIELPTAPVDRRAQVFLVALTAVPIALTVFVAVVDASNLRSEWATGMFVHVGLLAIALTATRFTGHALPRIAIFAAILLVIAPFGYALVVGLVRPASGNPMLVNWPQAEIAERMGSAWRRATGSPLRIVAGDNRAVGVVGLTAKDEPAVLVGGDLALSPWISSCRLAAEGLFVVWEAPQRIPKPLLPMIALHPVGEEHFPWRHCVKCPDLVIKYAIISPRKASECL